MDTSSLATPDLISVRGRSQEAIRKLQGRGGSAERLIRRHQEAVDAVDADLKARALVGDQEAHRALLPDQS